MTKRALIVGVIVGAAVATIALITVGQFVTGGSCSPTRESQHAAAGGVRSITIATTSCRSGTEVLVMLMDSGETHALLIANSSLSEPDIEARWISQSLLELHYPAALQVRFPPELTRTRHYFGQTEVVYKPR